MEYDVKSLVIGLDLGGTCMRSLAMSEVMATPFFISASIVDEIASSLR